MSEWYVDRVCMLALPNVEFHDSIDGVSAPPRLVSSCNQAFPMAFTPVATQVKHTVDMCLLRRRLMNAAPGSVIFEIPLAFCGLVHPMTGVCMIDIVISKTRKCIFMFRSIATLEVSITRLADGRGAVEATLQSNF